VSGLFWAALVLCAALSGFFALASDSLRMFRRAQLEEAFGGGPGRDRLRRLEEHLKALRLTCSLGRSLANLGLILCVLERLGGGGWLWVVGSVAIAGLVIAVFGVAIPHAWASYGGERFLARTLGVLLAARWAFWPITRMMQAFDVPIRRLSGVSDEEDADSGDSARQEILQVASDGAAEGAVDAEEVEMIESVIELGETQAGEIMTPRTEMFALPVNTPWQGAAEKIFHAGHSRVPVYHDDLDHIVGILYAKDLLRHVVQQDNGSGDLKTLLRKPFFVPETKLLDDLLREFKARKFHIAVVLDEYGGTAGLVTIEDVLEEIVGDIADEHDRAEPALMNRIDERTSEVDGRLHVDDLNDAMSLAIPEDEDYDTVAGFVFSQLGRIPTPEETLESHGARFTILDATERRISRLKVEVLDHAKAGGR